MVLDPTLTCMKVCIIGLGAAVILIKTSATRALLFLCLHFMLFVLVVCMVLSCGNLLISTSSLCHTTLDRVVVCTLVFSNIFSAQ